MVVEHRRVAFQGYINQVMIMRCSRPIPDTRRTCVDSSSRQLVQILELATMDEGVRSLLSTFLRTPASAFLGAPSSNGESTHAVVQPSRRWSTL